METVEFGPGVYAARIVRAAVKDMGVLLDQTLEAGSERRPSAGITVFDQWARAHEHAAFFLAVFQQSMDDVERLLRACIDMAESIALLMETNGRSVISPLVLSRSLGEGVMRICHVIAADVPPSRTLARMAAFQLEAVEGNLRTAQAFGAQGVEEGERARGNIAEMQAWFTDHGIELGAGRVAPFTAWVRVDGETENIEFNATDAYKRHMPRSVWHWSLGSGVTHSRGWMLPSVVGVRDEEALSSTIEMYVTTADAILELGDALATAASAHVGLDVDSYLKKNHLRRRGLLTWVRGNSDLAVGHREYAARGAEWTGASSGHLGEAFRRE